MSLIDEGLKIVEIRGPLQKDITLGGPAVHPSLGLGVRGFEKDSAVGRPHIHHEIGETAILQQPYFPDYIALAVRELLPVALAADPDIAGFALLAFGFRRLRDIRLIGRSGILAVPVGIPRMIRILLT